jgi:hypothetical protein
MNEFKSHSKVSRSYPLRVREATVGVETRTSSYPSHFETGEWVGYYVALLDEPAE